MSWNVWPRTSLLSDVESLKSSLSTSNSKLQFVVGPLLDSFLESRTVLQNVNLALGSISTCVRLIEICSQSNYHLSRNNFYMALKCLDSIETKLLDKTSSSTLRRMLENKIPKIRMHIERLVSKEFDDWLVEI
nr:exocyst complex component sec15b [Quercus suber]